MSEAAPSLLDRARRLLAGRTPAEQLAEIRERIATAEAEVKRLDSEIGRRAMAVMTGDADAVRVCAELEREKQRTEADLRTLRAGESDRLAAMRAEEENARRAAAAALPGQIAAANVEILELDDEIIATFTRAAELVKRRISLGQQHAALVGSQTLARVNAVAPHRIRSAIANLFRLDLAAPNTESNNLLHLRSDEIGPRAWLSLRELDQEYLDDEAAFYVTEAEALAAKERLEKRGTPAAVVPIGACWTAERQDRMFVSRADAETALEGARRLGRDDVVIPHGPGWLLRARRFADAAILGAGAD